MIPTLRTSFSPKLRCVRRSQADNVLPSNLWIITAAVYQVVQTCFGGLEVGSCDPSSPNWLKDFLDVSLGGHPMADTQVIRVCHTAAV